MGGERVQLLPNRGFTNAVAGELFTSPAATFTSGTIAANSYNKFLLTLNVDVTGTTTSMDIFVQFAMSNTAASFHNYESGPFGSLRVATTSADFCIKGDVMANFMKVNCVSAGCSATAFYSVTAEVTLQSS